MPILLAQLNPEDEPYAPRLKPMVGTSTVFVKYNSISTIAEVIKYCEDRKITGVITTNTVLLGKLLTASGNPKTNPSLSNYAGSYIKYRGIEFVFLNPLEQLQTLPYGSFIARRYISKLSQPELWSIVPSFRFEILTPSNFDSIFTLYQSALFISVDIETVKQDLQITCIGYTAVLIDPKTGKVSTHTCTLQIDSMYAVAMMRRMNWELQAPKALQNGKYDCSYLSRYNAVLYNYLWDTATMFHSWYSELPKDLAFLGAFCVREAMYWKDLAESDDMYERLKYNGLDTYTTALVVVQLIQEMPEWALENYQQEFPLLFPCHLCEMTGIKQDEETRSLQATRIENEIISDNDSLSKMLGVYPAIFNTNSAPQNKSLRIILGCGDIGSSDEIHLKKIGERHPVNKRITNKILDIRGKRKLVSTYLVAGKDFHGRILYSLNPHGTDTGRLASREHHFWCGLQIQNVPRGKEVKCTLIADNDFRFAEVDLAQAESRGTAYISGSEAYIAAVSGERDFHSVNASAFFGIPYEEIYDDSKGKPKNKALRDTAKRVNHGANYLMGPQVLIDTMGEDKIWEARKLLGLHHLKTLYAIAEYLLARFHASYPTLASVFYPAVVAEVLTTRMLKGATGWVRWCFGDPKKNKRDKNAYVAHVPQSLNAMQLNKAFLRVFYEIAINPKYTPNFKLCAQIHDSILFQFRVGHEYLCQMVKDCMEIPCTVKGYDGKVRTFTVPADIKAGEDGLGALRWSETE